MCSCMRAFARKRVCVGEELGVTVPVPVSVCACRNASICSLVRMCGYICGPVCGSVSCACLCGHLSLQLPPKCCFLCWLRPWSGQAYPQPWHACFQCWHLRSNCWHLRPLSISSPGTSVLSFVAPPSSLSSVLASPQFWHFRPQSWHLHAQSWQVRPHSWQFCPQS